MAQKGDRAGASSRGLILVAVICWITALAARLWAGRGLPLWIDESWTGMIASQSGWSDFWREASLDVNPPLYYALMALWTKIVGTSDMALRLPSLIFVAAAAALPLLWRPLFCRSVGLSRSARLCWSGLLILWWPGFEISLDARGYGLLLFLSVAQLLACSDALERGSVRSAMLWAALSAAAILTHYFAILPAGVQGLFLLWQHRSRAFRLWPAALPFIPALGWIVHHAPRLADYARPDVAWYAPVSAKLALAFFQYVLGPPGWTLVLIGGAFLGAALLSRGAAPVRSANALSLENVARCGAIAFVLLLAIGAVRASLTDRYLVPIVPSVLLGLVLLMRRQAKAELGYLLLLLVYLVPMATPQMLRTRLKERTFYGFERASTFLSPSRPQRLTFVWDHPAAQILDAQSLAKLGSFFFNRVGHTPVTRAIRLTPGEDGNRILSAASSGDAVIWIYNRARASAARTLPPNPALWPGWTCQHERGAWVGILACVPVAKAARPARVISSEVDTPNGSEIT